ncbi:low molecular weight phosphotyrosine protein phosphatase [Aliikangiella coralliicola]|uniref:Low molecular weight phosphotyrosine protein phosphatase n=2 Tax=Aliikangiella coralliicola TaxID=2592383 RepID=A0A545U969_9GAMM|nr:low molecular weight phosphotyrosine protein phosphatase [Aliikangiella coralliicola]
MGNICRSPTAEGVFRRIADTELNEVGLSIDSAGTIGYHCGEHADHRSIKAAKNRGYDLSKIISRQVRDSDFSEFDLILAMDKENFRNLIKQAEKSGNGSYADKIKLFLDFSKQSDYEEVPDPYYGGEKGFDLVIDLIEDASRGLINFINKGKAD